MARTYVTTGIARKRKNGSKTFPFHLTVKANSFALAKGKAEEEATRRGFLIEKISGVKQAGHETVVRTKPKAERSPQLQAGAGPRESSEPTTRFVSARAADLVRAIQQETLTRVIQVLRATFGLSK